MPDSARIVFYRKSHFYNSAIVSPPRRALIGAKSTNESLSSKSGFPVALKGKVLRDFEADYAIIEKANFLA